MDPQQVSNARKYLLKLLKTYTYAIACLLACSSGHIPSLLLHPLLGSASSLPHLFLPLGTTPNAAIVDTTVEAPTAAATPLAWLGMVLRV